MRTIRAVVLEGDFDAKTAPGIKDRLLRLIEQGSQDLIVNLDHVESLDCSGLGALITAQRAARSHNRNLVVSSRRPRVRGIFEITGLTRMFRIFENNRDAAQSLRSAATASAC